MGYFICGVER